MSVDVIRCNISVLSQWKRKILDYGVRSTWQQRRWFNEISTEFLVIRASLFRARPLSISPLLTRVTSLTVEWKRIERGMHIYYVSSSQVLAKRVGGGAYTPGGWNIHLYRLSRLVTETRSRWRADSMDGFTHRSEVNTHLRTLERPDDERSFHLTEQTRDKRPMKEVKRGLLCVVNQSSRGCLIPSSPFIPRSSPPWCKWREKKQSHGFSLVFSRGIVCLIVGGRCLSES